MWTQRDSYFMSLALKQAEKAYEKQEVPVGAVITHGGQIVAEGHNVVQKSKQAIAHADLICLQKACQSRQTKYLPDCTLYVTLEPCPMCAGACHWTQLGKLVFAAKDEKRGYQRWNPTLLHPKTKVIQGVLAEKSSHLLQSFFKKLRHS